jgi:lactate permease
VWSQSTVLPGHGLLYSTGIAFLPILTLVLLLGVFRKPAWMASPCGLAVAFGIAALGYHMPARLAFGAMSYGAAFALFPILWIIFWALCLLRVVTETGQFEIIKSSIGQLTGDPRLQGLLIAFAFAGFLEGAAGFGAPVAIAATMLMGLGFSAYNASAISLLANTAPVAFGSIGVPVFTLAATTGLSPHSLSPALGALCTPAALILPLYIVVAMGGTRATRGILFPILVAGVVFAGGQLLVSTLLGPQLTDILASLATILALVVVLRLHPTPVVIDASFATDPPQGLWSTSNARLISASDAAQLNRYKVPKILRAWAPYGILVIMVLLWGWAPLQPYLAKPTIMIPWPSLHNAVIRMPPIVKQPSPYPALFVFNWLAAAGTACMAATVLSAVFLRMSLTQCGTGLVAVARKLLLPTVTIVSVLALAFLMNYSGATATLGLAFAGTGVMFPFFSTLLGWVGVFLTGSDTSANALFGNLQVVTAERIGLSPIMMAAAGSAGGVMGKMISLQTIAIAAAATGLTSAEQATLFRFTLKHSIVLVALTGCAALVLVYAFHFQ